MTSRDEMMQRMRAGKRIETNGRVLRAINLMCYKYERLIDVQYALYDVEEALYLDSINYLYEAGYIKLRRIDNRAAAGIEDDDWTDLEAKLTEKGICLLDGLIIDKMVKA